MQESIRHFRIKVRGDNVIEVTLQPGGGEKIPPAEVKRDPFRIEVINLLIQMLRDNRLVEEKELKFLGRSLWEVLLNNHIGALLNRMLREPAVLRVELEFEKGQEELAVWPWEYLYCPLSESLAGSGYFLAYQTNLVLTRNLPLYDIKVRSLGVDDSELPLRVLFVAASPTSDENDLPLDQVQYEKTLESIQMLGKLSDPREPGRSRVEVMVRKPFSNADGPVEATFPAFISLVENLDPHVIHLVCHGRCTAEGGQIAFMKVDATADWVTEDDFATVVRSARSLRLVFLQACESALRDPYQAVSGVAMRLAHNNIPAVVAMQYKIEQSVASRFAREFYKALANSETIESAITRARKEIWSSIREWASSKAFGLPVLFLRSSGDGTLLAVRPEAERPAPAIDAPAQGNGKPRPTAFDVAGRTELHGHRMAQTATSAPPSVAEIGAPPPVDPNAARSKEIQDTLAKLTLLMQMQGGGPTPDSP